MITNSFKEIGGYFGLELENRFNNIPIDAIALNSARNALRYVVQAYGIKEIYIPYYTCPVVWEAIEKENCSVKYYHIDNNFMPIEEFPQESFILYTNYFGICAKNVKELAEKYKNLIVDNAQAFYMPKYGIASFNSIRKFFGVPDGALLFTDKTLDENLEKDISFDRCSHLLKRLDVNAKFGYKDFQINDDKFNNEPIKYMSELTKTIFNSFNTKIVKEKRLQNFKYLHDKLSEKNDLKIVLNENDIPMIYPYMTNDKNLKTKLIKNKIYIPTYWSMNNKKYSNLIEHLIPLPIDQRNNENDMEYIVEKIKQLEVL